ncbi:unnamed protein product, partial [Hymenolepis diminuta]
LTTLKLSTQPQYRNAFRTFVECVFDGKASTFSSIMRGEDGGRGYTPHGNFSLFPCTS